MKPTLSCLPWLCLLAVFITTLHAAEVVQPARSLPVIAEVDVIVVGGSSAGVTAAVKAAQQGAKVFLAAPQPYLGEDICGTYRLWLEVGQETVTPLARELFGKSSPLEPVAPMQVKRALDIKALQKLLIEKGNLLASMLAEQDSPRLTKKKIETAVYRLPNGFDQLEVVLDNWEIAQPILREAYAEDTDENYGQRAFAHVLGVMGDATGAANLAKAVAAKKEWDAGWRYKGMGQYGPNMSPLDSLIIALGRTKSPLALKVENNPPSGTDNGVRNKVLPEIHLARALYRCGDYDGVAEKILRAYANDLHAHYARHAQAILQENIKP